MWIKIFHCNVKGAQFENLTDGSIHEVIEPPKGFDNERGWWVKGIGEPVLVLYGEATEIRNQKKL